MPTNDPRFPTDVYHNGWRVRDVYRHELQACGFSEAEVITVWLSLTQPHDGDPLLMASENIIGAKVVNNWPLLPHEKSWLAKHAMEVARERYSRLDRERFLNCYPSSGLKIEKWLMNGYQPTYEEYFGVVV